MLPLLTLLLITGVARAVEPAKVDFQREVRPILSDACFHCHGPDKETRMAGLRLDQRESVLEARKSGRPVAPGKPDESLVWQRISHKNPALRMPPAYSHKTLNDQQRGALRRWIEQGAQWEEHWAFIKPERPALPEVKDSSWARNAIDRFVLARLEDVGLKPNAEAPKHVLIRRVALDLTGLPPKPEEIDAFLADTAPNAYERMVDRYLASPHYGEHRARYWLDAARYADTHGIHIDNYREMWPYRDWVIQAFNRNLPFDRFTIDQLAGDLFPGRTFDQLVATGFNRCNPTTNEAGAIEDEFAAIYAKDRVDTTSTVWMGLTVGCATCHDHKFDPILQKDFYALTAFFRNTTQPVMDGNISDTPPVIAVPGDKDRARWNEIDGLRTRLLDQLRNIETSPNPQFERWLKTPARRAVKTPLPVSDQYFRLDPGSRARVWFGTTPRSFRMRKGVESGASGIEGLPALHFEGDGRVELPNIQAIQADQPFSVSAWFMTPKGEGSFVIASQVNPYDGGRGWVLDLSGRVPGLRINGDKSKGISVRGMFLVQAKPGTWNHVAATYDGTRDQAGLVLYVNGQRAMISGGGESKPLSGSINEGPPLRIGSDGRRHFGGGAIGDVRIYRRVLTEEEARALAGWPQVRAHRATPTAGLPAEVRQAFFDYYLVNLDRNYRRFSNKRLAFDHERSMIARRSPVTHVMVERADQKPFAHLLNRGMYDQPKARLEPDVPTVLPRMKKEYPRNRLGLAQWLMDADNPLTARVAVNRYWQEVFPNGLVRTIEDFGSQGEVPSHPGLLDWLAVEYRESGWDTKKFYRLMLTSSTYRQSAKVSEEKIRVDPDNRLLSRGPRFRLDGESIRDLALAASGLLVETIGGPSVKPYQPEGIWEAVAMPSSNTKKYVPDAGGNLYRRSLYWFWKRSAPPASLSIFNAPTRELCTVRRERTNTPLQALVTMNDVQFVEAARALAEHAMLSFRNDVEGQFDFMAKRLLARSFQVEEKRILRASYRDYLRYYDSNPADARRLISTGDSERDLSLPPPEFAALTMVASQVMNLDEVLTK